MRSTPSSTPWLIRWRAPPGMVSSAGCSTSRMRPPSIPLRCSSVIACAAPSRQATWASWPQACATPSTVLTQGSAVSSATGSASMSARSATVRSPSPSSATRPERGIGVTVQPSPARRCAHSRVVRSSSHERSGWACRSRRSSTRSSAFSSTTWVISAAMSIPSRLTVVGLEDAVGRHGGRELTGQHPCPDVLADRPDPRVVAQSLLQLVAHQRPGEVELLPGALVVQPGVAEMLPVPQHLVPDAVDADVVQPAGRDDGRGPLAPAPHQPQRAGQLTSRGAGLALPVAVGLVHRDHVGDLEDALLDALELVTGARDGEEQEG